MGRVLLCVGKYADKPYFLERLYVNVYSAEELCYCLMQNAFLIGKEIVDEGLAEWLANRIGGRPAGDDEGRVRCSGLCREDSG